MGGRGPRANAPLPSPARSVSRPTRASAPLSRVPPGLGAGAGHPTRNPHGAPVVTVRLPRARLQPEQQQVPVVRRRLFQIELRLLRQLARHRVVEEEEHGDRGAGDERGRGVRGRHVAGRRGRVLGGV
jgi:hypothetical protein